MVASRPKVDWVGELERCERSNSSRCFIPRVTHVLYDGRWSILVVGMEKIYNFTSTVFGETLSDRGVNIVECEVHKDASWDPFADTWNVTSGGSTTR